jgi:type IV secretory pathway TrbD component
MSVLSYVRMVLWGFFGIRRRAGADEETARMRPGVLIAVGLSMAALFGLLMWTLANVAVHTLSR